MISRWRCLHDGEERELEDGRENPGYLRYPDVCLFFTGCELIGKIRGKRKITRNDFNLYYHHRAQVDPLRSP